ncbi:MAG: enterobactin transporter EntS, partial [Solimonas sp.]
MTPRSLFVDTGLLRHNRDFRNVFVARTISLLGLGMLALAIPLQVYQLSGDSLRVGVALALEGIGLFAGLLLGGVLADRHDRRTLILFARGVCGLGFFGLALNACLPLPSLLAIYLLSAWDGFFSAIGVTALLAAMPTLVGRAQLMQARALSMVSMRLATVLSPVLGGAIVAATQVGWLYLAVALATALTLLPLLGLPALRPAQVEEQHPLRALADGLRFLLTNRVVLGATLAGTLVTLVTAVRVLFPALAGRLADDGGGAFMLGLMYAAVSLGATLGMLLSGWTETLAQPGRTMQLAALGAFACVALLGLAPPAALALPLLAAFGYLVSIASLLQYALVQGHTPDAYLGRVNALSTAQDAAGETLGGVGIGLLGRWLAPLAGLGTLGIGALLAGGVLLALLR